MSSACKQAPPECSALEPWSSTSSHALVRIHDSLASLSITVQGIAWHWQSHTLIGLGHVLQLSQLPIGVSDVAVQHKTATW